LAIVEQMPSERIAKCVHSFCAIASLAALVGGCTGPSHLLPNSDSISAEVKFVNGSGEPILVDDRPEDASLLLGAIAGSVTGRPKETLQTVRIGKLARIGIDLRNFSEAIAPRAATMTATAAASGLQIAPADTKFARASTFLKWKGPPSELTIGFISSDDSSKLTLVFFDRPCRMTGAVNSGEQSTYDYDVTIEEAGLSWLIITPKGSTESTIRVAPATIRPTLLVRPATP
jgi:hypothetical protein